MWFAGKVENAGLAIKAATVQCLFAVFCYQCPCQSVLYRVSIPVEKSNIFHVEAIFPAQPGLLTLHMFPNEPQPGLSGYARFVVHLTAASPSGRQVTVSRPDPFTWTLTLDKPQAVQIRYDVLPDESDNVQLDSHWIEATGGYFDARSLLLFSDETASLHTRLEVSIPKQWTVRSGLKSDKDVFVAPNFKSLVASPFLFGELQERTVTVQEIPYSLVFSGSVPPYDAALLDRNLHLICAYENSLFGSVPFDRFTALFRWRPDLPYGGGIEHLGGMYMNIGKQWMIDLPLNMSGTLAHEYFHSWDAERMHPRDLDNSGLSASGYTRLLWFQEGLANYYSNLALVRTKIISVEDFYSAISRDMTNLESEASRSYISLADASVLAGTGAHEGLDYYAGGEVVAFLLDLKIRQSSAGAHSLDDAMRRLYAASAVAGYKGYTEADLIAAMSEAAGTDLSALFVQLVDGKGSPPYASFLEPMGLKVKLSAEGAGKQVYKVLPQDAGGPFLGPITAPVVIRD